MDDNDNQLVNVFEILTVLFTLEDNNVNIIEAPLDKINQVLYADQLDFLYESKEQLLNKKAIVDKFILDDSTDLGWLYDILQIVYILHENDLTNSEGLNKNISLNAINELIVYELWWADEDEIYDRIDDVVKDIQRIYRLEKLLL